MTTVGSSAQTDHNAWLALINELNQLRAQRQAVLDLCAEARTRGSGAYTFGGGRFPPFVAVADVEEALGAAGDGPGQ